MSGSTRLGIPIRHRRLPDRPISRTNRALLATANSEATKDALEWGVRRSVRYHSRRRAFFDSLQTLSSFVSMLAGGAAASQLAQNSSAVTWLSLVVAASSGLALVSRASVRARDHHDLVKQFTELELKLVTATAEQVPDLVQQRLKLESTEPPVLRLLDAQCHNELCVAHGREGARKLPWFEIFAQLSDFGWQPRS